MIAAGDIRGRIEARPDAARRYGVLAAVRWVVAAAIAVWLAAGSAPLSAQIVPTPNPGRDCQTVRTCNFARGAAVRGCLSSYTCRVCRTVRSRCSIGNTRQVCERLVCTWGG